MAYEWNGRLYDKRIEMLDAIATDYLTAYGMHDVATVDQLLTDATDHQLALDCVTDFGLQAYSPDGPQHEERHGYTLDDIRAAIALFRATRPDLDWSVTYWQLEAFNSQTQYIYGTRRDADRLGDWLNRGRDINQYWARRADPDECVRRDDITNATEPGWADFMDEEA